jgi:hypothetical protein
MFIREFDGVLLKIDFEKAYDKVSWSFLQQAMRMKGFDPKWCRWIHDLVSTGSVDIRVNEDTWHNFQTKKGLRQGDLLAPRGWLVRRRFFYFLSIFCLFLDIILSGRHITCTSFVQVYRKPAFARSFTKKTRRSSISYSV